MVIGLFPALPAPPAQIQQAGGDALLQEAKGLRYAQRFYEAAALYRRYLQHFAGSGREAEARFWLAATLEQDQRWDEAAAAYSDFLARHPNERLLGKEARLNRVRCWGIRQGQSPDATPGLVYALGDEAPEVQVAAALQLARVGDRRAIDTLQKGLALPAQSEACRLALVGLGVKPQPVAPAGRFLVLRIQEKGKGNPVTMRLSLALARALGSYLSDEQLRQVNRNGVDLDRLSDQAASLPKGSVLFSVSDAKSEIVVTVE